MFNKCCIKLHRKTEQNGADPAEGPAGRTSLGPVRFSPFLRCSFTLLISKQIKKALQSKQKISLKRVSYLKK